MTMQTEPRGRTELLTSGTLLFAEPGYLACSVEELIKHAKVSKGLLMYHFGSKEGLLREILQSFLLQQQSWLQTIAQESDPTQRLATLIDALLDSLGQYRDEWLMLNRLLLEVETQPLAQLHWEDFYHPYSALLVQLFSELGKKNPQQSAQHFELYRRGVFISFFSQTLLIPLEQQAEAWLDWAKLM